jgi:hypothetical protein
MILTEEEARSNNKSPQLLLKTNKSLKIGSLNVKGMIRINNSFMVNAKIMQ